jgi:hypothetical protein
VLTAIYSRLPGRRGAVSQGFGGKLCFFQVDYAKTWMVVRIKTAAPHELLVEWFFKQLGTRFSQKSGPLGIRFQTFSGPQNQRSFSPGTLASRPLDSSSSLMAT